VEGSCKQGNERLASMQCWEVAASQDGLTYKELITCSSECDCVNIKFNSAVLFCDKDTCRLVGV
jgi:hypothetical protein